MIHAYRLVIRSDPDTNSKLGFGCSVSHMKGRPRDGPWAYLVVLVAGKGTEEDLGT